MKIVIGTTAARRLFAEVQRWVDRGLQDAGAALESMLYPLSALVPRRWRCPLELVELPDIARVVIDAVAIPPDSVKAFSATNCHFAGEDLQRANEALNQAIDQQVARRPRLGVHSKLHCHPFGGGAFLSRGDLHHGVHAPKALAWRRQRGLATAILHVVYPNDTPALAAAPWTVCSEGAWCSADDGRRILWRIRSWASDERASMVELGDARIVSDHHPDVAASRRKAYWQTRNGARWCDAQKAALRAAGYHVSRNLLGRGWRRYLLSARDRTLLLALPADFPRAPPRVLWIHRAWCDDFEPLDLPAWFVRQRGFRDLSLYRLARHYLAPDGEIGSAA